MLRDQILGEIATDGPRGFDRFMEMALYDPVAGYFGAGDLRSDRSGDFLTSPEVSPLFGRTLARFVAAERDRIGSPFRLVEVGGGGGTLLRPLLDHLDPPPEVVAVERSGAARTALGSLVPEALLADRVDPFQGVLIGNELLDNMPAALVVRRGAGWLERRVDASGADLVYVEAAPRPEVVAWADAFGGVVAEGGQVEVQLAVTAWVREHLDLMSAGTMLLIDYGDTADGLEHRRAEGTVRTYRAHHLGPDPLLDPGATDITMDVNFSAVIAAAEGAGATVELLRQEEFLEQWGLRAEMSALRRAELEAAREERSMERLRLRSRVTEAETLLHPRGLGDFRVAICRK